MNIEPHESDSYWVWTSNSVKPRNLLSSATTNLEDGSIKVAQPSTTAPNQFEGEVTKAFVTKATSTTKDSLYPFWADYRSLGEALNELRDIEQSNEDWKIDENVYKSACYIAVNLVAASMPAPRVFAHGPKSIVFNWSDGPTNRYMTISDNRISIMVSTPKRIERRMEYLTPRLPDQKTTVGYLAAAISDKPALFKLLGSGIDSIQQERIA